MWRQVISTSRINILERENKQISARSLLAAAPAPWTPTQPSDMGHCCKGQQNLKKRWCKTNWSLNGWSWKQCASPLIMWMTNCLKFLMLCCLRMQWGESWEEKSHWHSNRSERARCRFFLLFLLAFLFLLFHERVPISPIAPKGELEVAVSKGIKSEKHTYPENWSLRGTRRWTAALWCVERKTVSDVEFWEVPQTRKMGSARGSVVERNPFGNE